MPTSQSVMQMNKRTKTTKRRIMDNQASQSNIEQKCASRISKYGKAKPTATGLCLVCRRTFTAPFPWLKATFHRCRPNKPAIQLTENRPVPETVGATDRAVKHGTTAWTPNPNTRTPDSEESNKIFNDTMKFLDAAVKSQLDAAAKAKLNGEHDPNGERGYFFTCPLCGERALGHISPSNDHVMAACK